MQKICAILLTTTVLGTAPVLSPVHAQEALAEDESQTIIVQARRRDEDVQDVPAVIDTVTGEDIVKLNFRDFKDVQTVVPGLQLTSDPSGNGGSAKLRGVNFDVNASGFNSTVEFYLNDAPTAAGVVLQQLFDVGQIEVQRGPQGTLRGRASPSGSITVTTRKPDLYRIGGHVDMTANDIGTLNGKAAINLPVIEGIAAIRLAGVVDENEGDRVRPLTRQYGGRDPFSQTTAGRVSGLVQPLDWLRVEGVYQHLKRQSRAYDQVASFSEANPAAPRSAIPIATEDRLSVQGLPRQNRQTYDITNWRAEASQAGQVLIYQGQHNTQRIVSDTTLDPAVVFPGRNVRQDTVSRSKSTSHEVRLQNQARLFGMLDYVVGFFDQRTNSPTALLRRTPVRLPTALGGSLATLAETTIDRGGRSHERSFFGNVTVHLGEATELSGGLRHIDYTSRGDLVISGRAVASDAQDAKKWIYSASIKHNFTPDLMVYASTGSSWRPGINVIGDFNIAPSARERGFSNLPAETSRSYEIGLKSSLLDDRLRVNLAAYHQTFENYPYRAPNGVFFVNTVALRDATGQVTGTTREVSTFNFVGAVPVRVNGVEGDVSFKASDRWSLGVTASYALGKIKNGAIPCNDLDRDGRPDVITTAPTLAGLQAAVGADNLSACTVSQRSAFQSPFSATLQTEYGVPISRAVEGYLRGLVAYNGRSRTDPSNVYDDVGAYALANLYAGIRDAEGGWEIALFAKNLFDTAKALSRTDPLTTSYQQLGFGGIQNGRPVLTGPTSVTATSTYTGITSTPPREFGVNVRYAFGGR